MCVVVVVLLGVAGNAYIVLTLLWVSGYRLLVCAVYEDCQLIINKSCQISSKQAARGGRKTNLFTYFNQSTSVLLAQKHFFNSFQGQLHDRGTPLGVENGILVAICGDADKLAAAEVEGMKLVDAGPAASSDPERLQYHFLLCCT